MKITLKRVIINIISDIDKFGCNTSAIMQLNGKPGRVGLHTVSRSHFLNFPDGGFMKTFLFDFDGTLVDSMPIYTSSMLRVLDESGIAYNNDTLKKITPLGIVDTAKYFVNLGVNKSVEEIIEIMKRDMLKAYFETIPAKKNVVDTLKRLKDGGCHLNVLTASPHITLDACLKRLGIYELFDNIWSCDDFGKAKANPQIFEEASKKIGKSPNEILFLDDNPVAVSAAKRAGMCVCGVYDKSSEDYTDEIKVTADFYITDFAELMKLA